MNTNKTKTKFSPNIKIHVLLIFFSFLSEGFVNLVHRKTHATIRKWKPLHKKDNPYSDWCIQSSPRFEKVHCNNRTKKEQSQLKINPFYHKTPVQKRNSNLYQRTSNLYQPKKQQIILKTHIIPGFEN